MASQSWTLGTVRISVSGEMQGCTEETWDSFQPSLCQKHSSGVN
jgi:hypothetical protein